MFCSKKISFDFGSVEIFDNDDLRVVSKIERFGSIFYWESDFDANEM